MSDLCNLIMSPPEHEDSLALATKKDEVVAWVNDETRKLMFSSTINGTTYTYDIDSLITELKAIRSNQKSVSQKAYSIDGVSSQVVSLIPKLEKFLRYYMDYLA